MEFNGVDKGEGEAGALSPSGPKNP
jgi:hypothetical protein